MAGRARREWGTGSCYQTKRGYWRVSVPLPSAVGRRRQEWQYRTEAAARRQLEAVQRRLARGLPVEEGRMTVAEYALEWLAQLQVKPATSAMYGSIVRHQLGHLAEMRLTRVAPPDIRAVLKEREREGYSGRTRRAVLDVLRMIFRLAEHDGLVERNPAATVTAPRIDAKEPVHLDATQARRFLDAASDDALYALYALALGTGLRRGELLALTWRDIGPSLDHLVVRRGKTAAAARTVPIPSFAAVALRALRPRPLSGPIWPYSPSYVTRHVAVICQRAGVPVIGMHALRHSCASILLAEGVPIEVIRSILGHSRVEMSRYYARPEDDARRAALDKLGRAIA
jgi:integrase